VSDDPPLVNGDLAQTVTDIIAHVLMVDREDVRPDRALVAELGAESIDFLDLIFRIETVVGRKIPISHWEDFIEERLPGADLYHAITAEIVVEFARRESGGV
jgi:acyl carrier protein